MKTVRDVMTAEVVRLIPSNTIKTAIILMKNHNVGGLPVVDGEKLVGMVEWADILGKDPGIPVENVMDKEFVTVTPDLPVADAADLMAKMGVSRLVVCDAGEMVGIVTEKDLLPELGKSFDATTGLPRGDAMRDWGIAALKKGLEITVIFIDLDQFGQFNKKYGHIIGDKVLKHVAAILSDGIDEKLDLLCRYAGDEFVVVTTRDGEEARKMAHEIGEKFVSLANPELPEPVTGSIGVHGGKRTKEREQVHFEATLDNLINLASKSCTRAKEQRLGVLSANGAPAVEAPPPTQAPEPAPPQLPTAPAVPGEGRRLRIQGLNFSWQGDSLATAEVELESAGTSARGLRSGFALGNSALRLVVDAAAEAIGQFLPPGHGVVADSVNLVQGGSGEDIVLVTALLVTPQTQVRVSGSSIIKQDPYRAAAAALLDSINRQISEFLGKTEV
jgi:diguanylate cyclase (GGDEF)-like protein